MNRGGTKQLIQLVGPFRRVLHHGIRARNKEVIHKIDCRVKSKSDEFSREHSPT
jgi:hypothetical protein